MYDIEEADFSSIMTSLSFEKLQTKQNSVLTTNSSRYFIKLFMPPFLLRGVIRYACIWFDSDTTDDNINNDNRVKVYLDGPVTSDESSILHSHAVASPYIHLIVFGFSAQTKESVNPRDQRVHCWGHMFGVKSLCSRGTCLVPSVDRWRII